MAVASVESAPLTVRLVGELALCDGSRELPLPASRKTRALFAYLLLAGHPVRRERLCEMFFSLPNDPRAALRWSLTKIRKMLGERAELVHTDRETVWLDASGFRSDVDEARSKVEGSVTLSGTDLIDPAQAMLDEPLAGLDLSQLDGYAAWLAAERSLIDQVRARVFLAASQDEALTIEMRRRFAAEAQKLGALDATSDRPAGAEFDQTVQYCTAPDGTRIGYACTGSGPPLVKAANWLNHLELDWNSPIWGDLLNRLSDTHLLVRYDERGNGCSDWNVEDLSFEAFVQDLETVVDTTGVDRFALLGISQGCAVSIEYACRHPERVTKLVLVGGYAAGWRVGANAETTAEREAIITLVRAGWGQDNPAYRQLFSQTFFPQASKEELDWFNDFQRRTTSAENAARFLETFADIDVRHCLHRLHVPTLVIHSSGDQRVAHSKGVELAAEIPGASMVTLDSNSHLPLSREPAMERMLATIESFLRSG